MSLTQCPSHLLVVEHAEHILQVTVDRPGRLPEAEAMLGCSPQVNDGTHTSSLGQEPQSGAAESLVLKEHLVKLILQEKRIERKITY